jgi:hypothetical protein
MFRWVVLAVVLLLLRGLAQAASVPMYSPPGAMGAPDLTGLSSSIPIILPIDSGHFFSETYAAESTDGKIVVVGVNDAVVGPLGSFVSVTVRYYTSTDGGQTFGQTFDETTDFTDQSYVSGYGFYFASDPSVVYTNGTFYAGAVGLYGGGTCTPPPTNYFGVMSSTDGIHWSHLHPVGELPGSGNLHDRPMLATGPSGDIWASWNAFNNQCQPGSPHIAQSTDGGVTWHVHTIRVTSDYQPDLNPVVRNVGGIETAIVPLMFADHVGVYSCPANVARCSLLATLPARPTPDEQYRLLDMGAAERINSFVSAAIDDTGNNILLAWMEIPTLDDRTSVIVEARSTNGGVTWTAPNVASSATTEQFFPSARYDNGTPSLCFYEEQTYGTRDYDVRCGAWTGDLWTWQVVSPAGTIKDAPGPNSNFVGDYIGRTSRQVAAISYHPNSATGLGYEPFIQMLPYPNGGGCMIAQPRPLSLLDGLVWIVPVVLLLLLPRVRRRGERMAVGVVVLVTVASLAYAQSLPPCGQEPPGACCLDVDVITCPLPPACVGDCNGDGEVTVDELITGVGAALADDAGACPAVAAPPVGTCTPPHWEGGQLPPVPIACLQRGVRNSLYGCPQQ